MRQVALVMMLYEFTTKQRLGSVSWHCSLDKEIQDANLWTSRPAILTETPNQVKLVIPKAGPVAHAFQSAVRTGEVEPQRRRLACQVRWGGYWRPRRSYHHQRLAAFSLPGLLGLQTSRCAYSLPQHSAPPLSAVFRFPRLTPPSAPGRLSRAS